MDKSSPLSTLHLTIWRMKLRPVYMCICLWFFFIPFIAFNSTFIQNFHFTLQFQNQKGWKWNDRNIAEATEQIWKSPHGPSLFKRSIRHQVYRDITIHHGSRHWAGLEDNFRHCYKGKYYVNCQSNWKSHFVYKSKWSLVLQVAMFVYFFFHFKTEILSEVKWMNGKLALKRRLSLGVLKSR